MKFKSTFFQKTLLILSLLLAITTQAWAETITLFSFTGTYAWPLATDWTTGGTTTAGGSYIKLSPGWTTSPSYSAANNVVFTYDVAAFGSGTNSNTKVYVLKTDGSVQATYTLASASDATYLKSLTLSIGNIDFDFHIKIEGVGNGTAARGTRLQNISLKGDQVAPPTTPTITTPATPLDFSKELGAVAVATKDLAIAGVNLTANITAGLSGANASMFALSKSNIDMAGETISITYSPTAVGSHTATLSLSSAGANPVVISLSGQCTAPALGVPTITAATQIANDGFTANWTAASQAESYELDVYTYQGGTGLTTIVSEDFAGCAAGQMNASANGTNIASTATEEVKAIETQYVPAINGEQWSGAFVYQAGGALKMGGGSNQGSLTTPTIDLSANGGAFRVSFDAMAWSADATSFDILLNDVKVQEVTGLGNTDYTMDSYAFDLTGGTAASKLTFKAKQASKARFFLDNLVITAGAAATKVSVAGYPMSVADVTTYSVGGLSPQTTYYYTVAAIGGQQKRVSAEASVTTDVPSGISSTESISTIYTSGGAIHLSATAGETIEVYNQMGQRLYSGIAVDGLNQLRLSARGVLVVKAGTKVAKVVL